MATKTKTVIDRRSLWVVIATVILIVLIVILGVLVHLFVEETLARIILIALICLLSVLGVAVVTYLELRKRKLNSAKTTAKNGYYYNNIHPNNAPKDTNWEYNDRTRVL
ncbi:uncharacterized protein LOC132701667 [Cylas formicarius]|uniref:uncharacterized protein LOC132701667 n=1 Tax=Cylas formicarius TaxID=197179 RepID=UPI0029584C94|nr:uncharacterized protein LOC132701667 [Cylas formicarius]